MNGVRKDFHASKDGCTPLAPGEYGKDMESGCWYCVPPDCDRNLMGCLGTGDGKPGHRVVEHEDGTITVSPSIEIRGPGYWHGFLERGIWRKC